MNRYLLLVLCILGLFLGQGCHKKDKTEAVTAPAELTEQSVTAFAQEIAKGIVQEHPDALNNAIDEENIRQLVSENSIVYSGFDVEGGKEYFEKCLHLGEQAVKAVSTGGDFAFTRYYFENGEHHVVFRTYDDFNLNFMDFVVDTVNGELKLKDGFIYNTGSTLSKNIEYSMLLNLMIQTNPTDNAHWLQNAQELTMDGQHAKALQLLKNHKDELKDYPLYYQLFIANLYKTNAKNFIPQMETLKEDIDERYMLLHKLLYYFNEGKIANTEEVINQLIPHTGDDPIYLLFYGKACMNAKDFQRALDCLTTAESALPLLWDLWYSELQCYKGLKDTDNFDKCLQRGKEAYGMSDAELAGVRKQLLG